MTYPPIPSQQTGSRHDTVSMRCLDGDAEADAFYRKALSRMQDINYWHELSKDIKADFIHCDEQGQKVKGKPVVGHYIKIDIPGPGNPSGEGYDWVKIVDVQEGTAPDPFFAMTVHPTANPTSDDGQTAHFYEDKASSTFIVKRLGNCVLAAVHGRNEQDNTDTGPLLDRTRNKLIAVGAKLGLGAIQWQAVTDAFVEPWLSR